ncbi:MAG: BadF/BadG/BcrA/BcrD ATPase family protein [Hydrogenoanaerobacterium sp.]
MVFDDIDLAACTSDVKLSTTCAVFAQSEIVELIADGVSPEKIVAATLRQIFLQAKTLLNKLDCGDTMVLSGGLTKIKGIRDFAETYLEKHIIIPDMSSYLSAMGCAIIAKEI